MLYYILGILIVGVFLYGLLTVISIYESKRLTVTHYKVSSGNIPKAFHGVKLAVLSDLHNHTFGTDNQRLLRAIDEEDPDYIFMTGDILVAKPGKSLDIAVSLGNALIKKYPVFYAEGNHEYRMRIYEDVYQGMHKEYISSLSQNVHWLINEKVFLERGGERIAVYGLSIDRKYYRRFSRKRMDALYLQNMLGEKGEEYTVLLAHNPDYFPCYAAWGAELTLSGHLHGGLIRVPVLGGLLSPMIRCLPKYDKGRFERNGKLMILSGGLGTHTINFRINNIPEILIIELEG